MATATFTSTDRSKATPEDQFRDDTEVDTEENFPLVLEDAVEKPKEDITVLKLRSRQVRLSHDQNI